MGVGACFKRTTLTDYFGAEAAAEYHKAKLEDGEDAVLVIENNIGVFDPAKIRHETKTFNNVKVRWCAGPRCCALRTLSPVVAGAQVVYSKEFPLSVDELLPIAEVMSRTQRHWVNFERFLKTKMPEGAWRPRRARHTHSRPQGAWVLCYVRACCVHDCRCRLPGDVQHPSVPDDSCGYVCGM